MRVVPFWEIDRIIVLLDGTTLRSGTLMINQGEAELTRAQAQQLIEQLQVALQVCQKCDDGLEELEKQRIERLLNEGDKPCC